MNILEMIISIKNRKKLLAWSGVMFLSVLANYIYDWIKNVNIFSILFNYIWKFLEIKPQIPLWFWLLTYGLIVYLYFKIPKNNIPVIVKDDVPDYVKNYTSEIIDGVNWIFDYDQTYKHALTINPHCIECGSMLKFPPEDFYSNTEFYCEKCKKGYPANYIGRGENVAMAARQIDPKIIILFKEEGEKNK